MKNIIAYAAKHSKLLLSDLKRIRHVDYHWLVIWIFIYATFLILDILSPSFFGATLIKYIGIFLCLIYAYQKFRTDHLLILALLLTLLADTFLVWTTLQIPGVFCFCFAQFFHISRLSKAKPKALLGYFLIVFLLFAAGIIRGLPPLHAITFIYAATLILNLILAFRWSRTNPNNFHARCAGLGFALFLACDICVALQFLTLENALPITILPVISFLVWLFYYPSQVLISNSSNIAKETKT